MSTILDSLKKSSDKRGDTQNGSIHSFSFSDSNKSKISGSFIALITISLLTLTIVYFGYRYLYPDEFLPENSKKSVEIIDIVPEKTDLLVQSDNSNNLNNQILNQVSEDNKKIEKPNSNDVKARIQAIRDKQALVKTPQDQHKQDVPKQVSGTNPDDFQNLQKPLTKNSSTDTTIAIDKVQNQTLIGRDQIGSKETKKTYILAYQLPFVIRKDLPELKLNIHVFDTNPQNRIAIINGEKFEVNSLIADEVLLKEIVFEGVVLEFQQKQFLLPKL